MNMNHKYLRLLAPLVVTAAAVAVPRAQLPDGHYVLSARANTANAGGLFFVHPRASGRPVPVTGLPATLRGGSGGWSGPNSVVRRASDDALVVGDSGLVGQTVSLHVLRLNGNANTKQSIAIPIGRVMRNNVIGYDGVHQIALLPGNRALFCTWGFVGGALLVNGKGIRFGIADLATRKVQPFVTALPRNQTILGANCLAVSLDGKMAYVGVGNPALTEIWQVDMRTRVVSRIVRFSTWAASAIAVDNQGRVIVAAIDYGTGRSRIYTLTKSKTGWAVKWQAQPGPVNALVIERATDNFAVVTDNTNRLRTGNRVGWMQSGKPMVTLAQFPVSGQALTGIDVNHDPETFGTATPTATNSYAWRVAPNPGGLPLLGNKNFSLTVQARNPGVGVSAVVLAAGRLQRPILVAGLDVWVSVAAPHVVLPLSFGTGKTATLRIGIPGIPALRQNSLYAQSVHLDRSGLGVTSGVAFTPL